MKYGGIFVDFKLSHIGLKVQDIKKTKDFYCNLLGFEEIFRFDRDGECFFLYLKSRKDEYLEIFNGAHPAIKNGFPPQNVQHFTYLVDDIDATGRYFQEKGYDVYFMPSSTGQLAPVPFTSRLGVDASRICFLVDPDGNEVEFMQYTEDSLQLKGKQ